MAYMGKYLVVSCLPLRVNDCCVMDPNVAELGKRHVSGLSWRRSFPACTGFEKMRADIRHQNTQRVMVRWRRLGMYGPRGRSLEDVSARSAL